MATEWTHMAGPAMTRLQRKAIPLFDPSGGGVAAEVAATVGGPGGRGCGARRETATVSPP